VGERLIYRGRHVVVLAVMKTSEPVVTVFDPEEGRARNFLGSSFALQVRSAPYLPGEPPMLPKIFRDEEAIESANLSRQFVSADDAHAHLTALRIDLIARALESCAAFLPNR